MAHIPSRLYLSVAAALIAVVVLAAGCSSDANSISSAEGLFGLLSPDTAVTLNDTEYRLDASFAADPDRPGIEVLTVELDWESSNSAAAFGDITIAAYGADGTPRVEPAGYDYPGDASGEYESSSRGASGAARGAFSVRKGETGIVVSVTPGNQPDLRWLVR